MSVTVEDGTGIADANSYISGVDCAAYAAARGLSFTDDATGDAALIRGTTWLDAAYREYWPGVPTNGRDQGLQWPRKMADGSKVTDANGNQIADNSIPIEIKDACCEAAIREQANPGSLSPDVTPGKTITKAEVYEAVTVTYANSTGVAGQRPVSTVIDDILASLIGDVSLIVYAGQTSRG